MGNQRTVLDNKDTLTKQGKPYASTKCKCDDKDALRETCTMAILYYDLVSRQIRTLSSNGTFAPVNSNPWLQKKTFDADEKTFDADGNTKQSLLENSIGKKVPAQPGGNLKVATTAAEIASKTAIPDESKPQSFGSALANSAFGKLIARGEGDYNSVNRGARWSYKAGTENLGGMTVAQVMAQQLSARFNAAGRYQITGPTLGEAFIAMELTGAEKFDRALQDHIFGEYLVKEKRPAIADYIAGRSDDLLAALLESSKEWASVANPNKPPTPDSPKGVSYHDKKGKNKATISATEMKTALRNTRATYAVQLAPLDTPNKARSVKIK
ncbi:hypothetical protein KQH49_15175 [Mycetohabitans sp. B5]|uniref:Uncharacterized protein n=1 Tax=Mycetohabitans endofungorum TaxID=417203 RepID=A0A2P5K6G0_9BURK|nr:MULTISPECIES: hypothetical protein [Mycetohabitans]MCG1056183.1 hypothetical protein [Mycetohabitans sp. B5]PPB80122.1 hypothetical protein B0O95_1431 [Mycetohabitans endofungorum]